MHRSPRCVAEVGYTADMSLESPERPKRVVVAGIIVRDGRVLVVRNIKHGLRIEPPGGKVEEGESMEAAVERELSEELGIRVRVLRSIGVYETDSTKEGIFDVHTFLCEIVAGEPTDGLEPGKTDGFAWMTPHELSGCSELVASMRAALPDVRALVEPFPDVRS